MGKPIFFRLTIKIISIMSVTILNMSVLLYLNSTLLVTVVNGLQLSVNKP